MDNLAREAAERARWEMVWILIVLAVCALVLLPLGRVGMAWELARAFALLWAGLLVAAWLLARVQALLRVVDDPPTDAYVLSNLAVGAALLLVWTACLAIIVRGSAGDAPPWVAGVLHLVGLLASHAAYGTVSIVYQGTIYRTINLFAALGGYVVFAAWPAAARLVAGWIP